MPESLQHKLDRVRPPRVQITYDVEIGGAIEKKELPFVVGVLADLSGKPDAAAAAAEGPQVRRDRPRQLQRRAGGDRSPRLADYASPNKLTERRRDQMTVELKFEQHRRLRAPKVVKQVEPLRNCSRCARGCPTC